MELVAKTHSDVKNGIIDDVTATVLAAKYRMELDVLVKEMQSIQKALDTK